MKKELLHYPAPDEMSALIAAAHRTRARMMRVLVRLGVRAVKSLVLRLTAVPVAKRVSHA
jgi:hypothetical protein